MRDEAFATVTEAVRRIYADDAADGGAAAGMLAEVAAALEGLHAPEHEPDARALPAARLLGAAVTAACGGRGEAAALALAGLAPRLRWIANPNYNDDIMGAGYMANYGYCNLVGWDAFAERAGLACGFMLLGPGLFYPDHAHPAEEVYHPLTPGSEWSRDGGDFEAAAPGAAIHHPPWIRHATRAGDGPMLALFCWRGELGADRANLVRPLRASE